MLHLHAAVSKARQFFNGPACSHNFTGRYSPLKEGFKNVAAQLSGGACNNEAHNDSFREFQSVDRHNPPGAG